MGYGIGGVLIRILVILAIIYSRQAGFSPSPFRDDASRGPVLLEQGGAAALSARRVARIVGIGAPAGRFGAATALFGVVRPGFTPGSRRSSVFSDAAPTFWCQTRIYIVRSRGRLAGLRPRRAASGPSWCSRSPPRCWPSASASPSPTRCWPPTRARRRCSEIAAAIQEGAVGLPEAAVPHHRRDPRPARRGRVPHVDGDREARRQPRRSASASRACSARSPSCSAASPPGSPATSA